MWEVGAILGSGARSHYENQYVGIEDIWDKHPNMNEYISASIVENSPEFFERVYPDNFDKMVYKTKEQLKETFNSFTK